MEDISGMVFKTFDDHAYLLVGPECDVVADWSAEKFMRWHAESLVIEELGCTKSRAKKIVRGSLTRTGGVEHFFTQHGTYIHREMFLKYFDRVKEVLEREAEEKESLRKQKEVSREANPFRPRLVR